MAKKSYLESIESPLPCSKDWNEMVGDERVRFCHSCEKNVYNLSAMTRREARRFVALNSGKVCVRYVRLADGRVETIETKLYKIARRAPLLAAGVLGATLTLSAAADAQMTPATPKTQTTKTTKSSARNDSETSQISFTVVDQNGNAIANAAVKLTNPKTAQEFITITNSEGVALFNLIPPATYDVTFSASSFQELKRSVRIKEKVEPNLKVFLDVGSTFVGVVVDTWSEIPVFTLIAAEKNEEVKKAINAGFDVNTKSEKGLTALHVAVNFGNLELVKFLLEHKAKVNVKSKDKRTPLLMLEEMEGDDDNFAEYVRLLVAAGADVNVQDKQKKTALMIACYEESLEGAKILLEAGANPNLKDEDGETALEKTDSDEIKQLLKQYGAKE
jgi:hypothetical protein